MFRRSFIGLIAALALPWKPAKRGISETRRLQLSDFEEDFRCGPGFYQNLFLVYGPTAPLPLEQVNHGLWKNRHTGVYYKLFYRCGPRCDIYKAKLLDGLVFGKLRPKQPKKAIALAHEKQLLSQNPFH